MNTSLQHFNYGSQNVRTTMGDGEPWFVASDVAAILGYSATAAMTRRLDDDDKGVRLLHTLGGDQKMTVISEFGLYEAILGSKVEGAKRFKKWVTHTVLPAVMKHGVPAPAFDWINPAFQRQMLELQLATLDRAEAAESQLAIAAPKAAYADTITAKGDVHSVQEASNLLEDEGFRFTGRNTLFQWLRDHGWVAKNDRSPMQRAISAGLVGRKYYKDYPPTTLVTARGLARIHELMLKEIEDDRRAAFREIAPVKPAASRKKQRRTLSPAA